jgi:ribosomal protein S13
VLSNVGIEKTRKVETLSEEDLDRLRVEIKKYLVE